MATSGYLRGHDFYALARRASEPGSAKAIPVTGFLNYDAWMLEGLETMDANVRALGMMMRSTDEELEAVDANLPPVLGYTDGRGRTRPGFRCDGLGGLQMEEAATAEARVREYAAKLSSASGLREPMSDFTSSSCRMFDEQFLSHLETIDHNLHCLLYTSPSPRDLSTSRMPSSA